MADRPGRSSSRQRTTHRRALDTPRESRRQVVPRPGVDAETFGRWSERFARFMGTPRFLVYMTGFVALWLLWNTVGPPDLQFDPRELNYTLLTLILSLQASYAAPLILLAQNRQDDRDRVSLEQDRQRAERNLADTEYLAREVAALRIAMRDVATRDFLRSELRDLVEELAEEVERLRHDDAAPPAPATERDGRRREVPPSGAPGRAGDGPAGPDRRRG